MVYNELYHHGVKGQRWGVIRTPAQLGHYIKAKRAKKKRQQNLKRARQIKNDKKIAAEQRQKDIDAGKIKPKDMTESELIAAKRKLELAREYKRLMDEVNPPAKAVSEGKNFANKFWNEAIKPGVTEAGKQIIKDALLKETKKLMGPEAPDALKELQRQAAISKAQRDISDNKRRVTENHDWHKKREEKQKDSNKKESKKENNNNKSDDQTTERYEPGPDDIIGEGTSRRRHSENNSSSRQRSNNSDPIDVQWTDVSNEPISNLPATTISSGRDYVDGLLEDHSTR